MSIAVESVTTNTHVAAPNVPASNAVSGIWLTIHPSLQAGAFAHAIATKLIVPLSTLQRIVQFAVSRSRSSVSMMTATPCAVVSVVLPKLNTSNVTGAANPLREKGYGVAITARKNADARHNISIAKTAASECVLCQVM